MNAPIDPTKKDRRTIAGVIVAGLAASVCCVGPLVLLGLGVGGAWVGNLTALEPFRPYLMAITFGVLGYAFYKIYKPKAEVCEPGSYCANPKSDKINKITLWISTIFVLGLLATPYIAEELVANENAEADRLSEQLASLKQITLDVPGMNCPACPFTVQKSLKKLDGVVSAKATLEDKKAVVIFNPSIVSTDAMIEATTNAGYPSTVEQ
jgi:mercuric ion transport protein